MSPRKPRRSVGVVLGLFIIVAITALVVAVVNRDDDNDKGPSNGAPVTKVTFELPSE